MLLTLTIATLAAALGSKLSLSSSDDKPEQSSSMSLNNNTFEPEQNNIPIIQAEEKGYTALVKSLIEDRDLETFQCAIRDIESVYWMMGLLKGEETESYIGMLLSSRFNVFIESQSPKDEEKIRHIKNMMESMKSYIEFLFIKTNKVALEKYYNKELAIGNIGSLSTDIPTNMPANELEKYRDKFDEVFTKITTANEEINNNGLKTQPYCYYDLLNDAGKVYDELVYLNNQIGCVSDPGIFSTVIVDEIAETILNNTNFYFCRDLTPSVLSKDLTKHIIHYLHHNQPLIDENETLDSLVRQLDQNYFCNRKIRNYYYFLILCARFVKTLRTNWIEKRIMRDINNEEEFEKSAKTILFDQIEKHNYKFLRGLSLNNIWEHILATKAENETS